jgi:hypothetical protein
MATRRPGAKHLKANYFKGNSDSGKSEKTFGSNRHWFKTTPGALGQRTNR